MECKYYRQLDDERVECQLCPHHCKIAHDKTGICRSRRNKDGVLVSEVYGKRTMRFRRYRQRMLTTMTFLHNKS